VGSTAGDRRYLEWHHGSWRVVVGHREAGKVYKLRRALGTSSLREAQRRRWAVVAALKACTHPQDSEGASAESWRAALSASSGEPYDPTQAAFSDHLDRLPLAEARELATQVYQTPLDLHLDAFLASRGELKGDTEARHRHAVVALTDWLRSRSLPPTIEAVDRRIAIAYSDQLQPGRPDPHRLSLYWRWMATRQHATEDPWRDLGAPPRARGEPQRPFTDEEVLRLLQGPCSGPMRELMMVAALSGARLDAVLHLTIQDDCFLFPPQKKERGPRRVPIHSALLPVRQPLWAWKTSAAASQQFITYRRSLGVEPVFHSFRRWFISKAEQAGQPESVIAAVVGHRRPGLTFGRYSSGPGVELMRACVEAVKLPT
jgi:hypothetical protein